MSSLRIALLGVVALALTLVALAPGASVTVRRSESIDPGTRVNGMLVVQGLAQGPALHSSGSTATRTWLRQGGIDACAAPLPRVRRIFVGHGVWAVSKRRLESWWRAHARQVEMRIDGQPVQLSRFGHSDRWLYDYPEADGRDALLRGGRSSCWALEGTTPFATGRAFRRASQIRPGDSPCAGGSPRADHQGRRSSWKRSLSASCHSAS